MPDPFRREVLNRISASRKGSIPQHSWHQTARLVWTTSGMLAVACVSVVVTVRLCGADALDMVVEVVALAGAMATLITVVSGLAAPRCRCRRR
ncbi:hypothetical protein ACFVT5_20980 [Streptomyces sp. NPDC058001]|uniref:hypothetical protein n=1 Tax=Streptomyces sp. NPDC058001 TaxID=3346300 RepID=UPI0036E13C11